MDFRRSTADVSGHKVSHSITSALVSAALEWILMLMIFVDASFAYLVTKFARHYRLPTPCLLCSRLDHALGNERAGFYWDLMCHEHKSKISSLVLGQLHNDLVDNDAPLSMDQTHSRDADPLHHVEYSQIKESSDTESEGLFSDNESSRALIHEVKASSQESVTKFVTPLIKSSPSESEKPTDHHHNVESVGLVLGQLHNNLVDNDAPSSMDHTLSRDADPLPHVEYSQIKDSSDTESEGLFSDNESSRALIHEVQPASQESVTKFVTPFIKSSPSESEKPTDHHHYVESEAPLGHGLEELDWQESGQSKDVVSSELIDCSYIHPSPNADGTQSGDSKETTDATITFEFKKEVHVGCRETSNVGIDSRGKDELWKEVKTDCSENSKVRSDSSSPNEIQMDLKSNKTEANTQMTGSLDLGDAYKLALGARGRQFSGRLEQQRSITDRVSEDLKLLLSQISAVRGLDLSINDISPKVSANSEDFNAMGTQNFQRRISLERNESNLSIDGNSVGEVEGESDVDRLKRQIEHDKKILAALYKELEEERNASAVAANQAMAMITRLQEEKAAFHMEALQCVRMMEEQAEYDGEALQKAYLLLSEKEKQIENIQFELEFYRNRSGNVPSSYNFFEQGGDCESDELKEQILEANCGHDNTNKNEIVKKIDGAPKMFDGEISTLQFSLNQFEDEKRYIVECLKEVEKKLFIFTKHEVYSDMIVEGFSSEESLEASAADQPEFVGSSKENGGTETSHLKSDLLAQHENEEYGKLIPSLRHELYVINNRLQAVEAEQNVIECSIKALEKGSEGYEFIREIAARLHELHSAHVVKRVEGST